MKADRGSGRVADKANASGSEDNPTNLRDQEKPFDGRLRCCVCGADLGPADDPYRDPSCLACLNRQDAEETFGCVRCGSADYSDCAFHCEGCCDCDVEPRSNYGGPGGREDFRSDV